MLNRTLSFASEAIAFIVVLVAFLFIAALQIDNHRLSIRPTFVSMWHDASGTFHYLTQKVNRL